MTRYINKSKSVIAVSAFMILSNYYYLYFFDFNQGISAAGSSFNFIRFVAIGLLVSQLFLPAITSTFSRINLSMLAFCLAAVTVLTLKTVFLHSGGGFMFANMLLCAIPATTLKAHPDRSRMWFFFDCCKYILSAQVILDYAIYLCGASIWDNKAFIGGLGNPSSFGVACCIFLAYSLLARPHNKTSLACASLLAAGALNTNALMPTMMVPLIVIFSFVARPRISVAVIAACFVTVLCVVPNSTTDGHTAYKMESLVSALKGSQADDISQSVSLREQIHEDYFRKLTDSPATTVFFGDIEKSYFGVDSQILTYLSSFGVVVSLFFLFYMINLAWAAISLPKETMYFTVAVIAIYSTAFVFNRILDYYPMSLFLFLCASVVIAEQRHGATATVGHESSAG
jgi:hypothetical protein